MRVINTAVLGFCVTSVLLATGIWALGQSPSPSPSSEDFAPYAMKLRESAPWRSDTAVCTGNKPAEFSWNRRAISLEDEYRYGDILDWRTGDRVA